MRVVREEKKNRRRLNHFTIIRKESGEHDNDGDDAAVNFGAVSGVSDGCGEDRDNDTDLDIVF